jgi:hypothetical protein
MLPPLIVGLRGSVPTTSIGESEPIGSCRVACGLACPVLRSLRERRQPLETKPTSGGDRRRLALARLREVAQRVPSDHRRIQALAGVLPAANRGGRAPYQHKRALGKTGICHASPGQLSRLRDIASPAAAPRRACPDRARRAEHQPAPGGASGGVASGKSQPAEPSVAKK